MEKGNTFEMYQVRLFVGKQDDICIQQDVFGEEPDTVILHPKQIPALIEELKRLIEPTAGNEAP